MSTSFFHSAAMSLLSRTLQTLLSKYLSDVDVEGVALPSLISDDDSGWGVRLVNVKLRHGIKLLDLAPISSTQQQQRESTKRNKRGRRKRRVPEEKKQSSSFDDEDNIENRTNERETKNDDSSADMMKQPPSSFTTTTTTSNNTNSMNTENEKEKDTQKKRCEETTQESHPPVRRKSSWFSSWYYRSSRSVTKEEEKEPAPAAPSVEEADGVGTTNQTTKSAPDDDNKNTVNDNNDFEKANRSNNEEFPPPPAPSSFTTKSNGNDIANGDACDDADVGSVNKQRREEEEEEEEEEVTQSNKNDDTVTHQDAAKKVPPTAPSSAPAVVQRKSSWFSSWYTSSSDKIEETNEQPSGEVSTASIDGTAGPETLRPPDDQVVSDDEDVATSNGHASVVEMPPSTTIAIDDVSIATSMVDPLIGNMLSDAQQQQQQDSSLSPEQDDQQTKFDANREEESIMNGSASVQYSPDEQNDHRRSDDEEEQRHRKRQQQEPPMILRLGEGGTIGVLDVRLVGKTIHVLIEDAFLTLEVVRPTVEPSVDGESSTTLDDNINTTSTTTDGTAAAAAQKKKKQPPPEPKTAGDRVLAENALARLFSTIPNLFLRDIRVRIIIRNSDDDNNNADSIRTGDGEEQFDDYDDNGGDTVIDVAIELLSVTDGDDFLSNFGATMDGDDEDDSSSSTSDAESAAVMNDRSNGSANNQNNDNSNDRTVTRNEYLTKRIRTGRGPEGGILLQIYSTTDDIYQFGHHSASSSSVSKNPSAAPVWARDAWRYTTQFVVLRCSGLDLQARIFLGTQKEIIQGTNNSWYVDENGYAYNDFEVDSMLFGGVDYIAPGPQPPPLPPIASTTTTPTAANASGVTEDEKVWHTGATQYVRDDNGIQSCGIPSSFHRISRGLVPNPCTSGAHQHHLPCEQCARCWRKDAGSARPHRLDSSTPLGGLVFHVSVRDPLELNIDRSNLEVIGLLVSLLSKKKEETAVNDATSVVDLGEHTEENGDNAPLDTTTHSERSRKGSSHHSRTTTSRANYVESGNRRFTRKGSLSFEETKRSETRERRNTRGSMSRASTKTTTMRYDEYDCANSFPTYMQPEKIQMLGVCLSELKLRVHVMRGEGEADDGSSYCYWDVLGKCVTLDQQKLDADERSFQDVRFDFGNLKVTEYKGVVRKQIISLGVRQRVVDFDDITVETYMTSDKNHNRSPWPSTAAALLDIPPPLESLVYEDRDRHGIQIRYITVLDPADERDFCRKHANLRVGAATVDAPFEIKNEIIQVIREAKSTVFGPPKSDVDAEQKPVESVLKYRLIADGGRFRLHPFIEATLPFVTVGGELSSEAGFSIKTLYEQVKASYGRTSSIRALDSGLSLQQLAALPDNVRLRVLLFLQDLKPLETALDLGTAANSFLRTKAVNKRIVKMARKVARKNAESEEIVAAGGRRQEVMAELLSLDDETLEDLLFAFRRNQRRRSATAEMF